MSKIYAGVDVSSKKNVAVILDGEGERVGEPVSFRNNLPGATRFANLLVQIARKKEPERMCVGCEAASVYSWHLQDFLLEQEDLIQFNLQVFSFNPKLIKKFKDAYPDLDKTDPIDAFIIADRLRFGRLPEAHKLDRKYIPLRRLTRFRYHLVESLVREKNHFLAQLFLKFSSYKQDKPFCNILGKTSCEILTKFSVEELAEKPLEELVHIINHAGKRRFTDPYQTAKELKKAARNSYRLPKCMKKPMNVILAVSMDTIKTLQGQINKVDKAVKRELKGFPNTLTSVKGLGPVYAAGIIAEIGGIDRFLSEGSLARYASLVWSKKQSGDFEAEDTYMKKSGNRYLRYYLVQAARSLANHNPEYSDYYLKKYAEARTHQHKRASVLTARKLVRLVHALLSKKTLYQLPEKYRIKENS